MDEELFQLPTDPLQCLIKSRGRRIPQIESSSSPRGPHIKSCFDEFSRDLISIDSKAKFDYQFTNFDVDAHEFSIPDEFAYSKADNTSVMMYFCPSADSLAKKLKYTEEKASFEGQNQSDHNILLRIDSINVKGEPFEPLFGMFSLYSITNDTAIRVSECFRFDLTSRDIQKKYRDIYFVFLEDLDSEAQSSAQNSKIDPATTLKMCLLSLPPDLLPSLYLIFQLSKVLTGDVEKAFSPYLSSTGSRISVGHEADYSRLKHYRQVVGLGALKVVDQSLPPLHRLCVHGLKSTLSDEIVGQYVRDLYPADGTSGRSSFPQLDLEICIGIHFLGDHSQMDKSLVDNLGFGRTQFGKVNCAFVPSQLNSSTSDAHEKSWEGEPLSRDVPAIRKLMYFPPLSSLDRSSDIKTSIDNTTFIYPLALLGFQHRNLCVKVQFIEFIELVGMIPDSSCPHRILRNLYNTIHGPLFCTALFSSVSYHSKSPVLYDEFKLRLPDVLTNQHWIKFTIQHVHVKQRHGGGIFGSSSVAVQEVGPDDANGDLVLGVGFLPLVTPDGSLLPDQVHHVSIQCVRDGLRKRLSGILDPSSSASMPLLRVSTRSFSSFISNCPSVQRCFSTFPVSFGRLTSSVSPLNDGVDDEWTVEISRIVTAQRDLERALPNQLVQHFLVLMRYFTRSLCGGNGLFDQSYSNPFEPNSWKTQSFLSLIQVLGAVMRCKSTMRDLLIAYVDDFWDEETIFNSDFYILSTSGYLELVGYSGRQPHIEEAVRILAACVDSQTCSEELKPTRWLKNLSATPTHIQWWPWSYEVISFQWSFLLGKFHESCDNLNHFDLKKLRNVVVDSSPILLKIILKSLCLRICQIRKSNSYKLDVEFHSVLCSLFLALARELTSSTTTHFGAKNLVSTVAHFFRTTLVFIVPTQCAQLISTFVGELRYRRRNEEVNLKLLFVEELSLFRHFVSINLIVDDSCGHSEFWLSELVIRECFDAISSGDRMLTESAIRILVWLVSFIVHDQRCQSLAARSRISVIFASIMDKSIEELHRISLRTTSEKKHHLILVLYLLQDLPEEYKRNFIRKLLSIEQKSLLEFTRLMNICVDTFFLNLALKIGGEVEAERGGGGGAAAAAGIEQLEKIKSNRMTAISSGGWKSGASPSLDERKWRLHTKVVVGSVHNGGEVSSNLLERFEDFGKSLFSSCAWIVSGSIQLIVEELSFSRPVVNNEEIISLCQDTLLLILSTSKDSSVLGSAIRVSTFTVKTFGAKKTFRCMSNSLQEWMRIIFRIMALDKTQASDQACTFLLELLRSTFTEFSSLTVLSDVILVVVYDVIEEVLQQFKERSRTFEEEELSLDLFKLSISKFEKMAELVNPVYTSICSLMEKINLIVSAHSQMRRFLSHPVGFDWNGGNMLDGPFDEKASDYVQFMRNERKLVVVDSISESIDVEEVMDVFIRVSDVFDPIRLPRQRIFWLENLARLHDVKQNRAESGAVRWSIFLLCKEVSSHWDSLWAPSEPLWSTLRGSSTSVNELISLSRHSQRKCWSSADQYSEHLQTNLSVSIKRFASVGLLNLAERSSFEMLRLLRKCKDLERMSIHYSEMGQLLKLNMRNSTHACGTYYWVKFVGRDVPTHLHKEFVYRNGSSLHVSEFHGFIRQSVEGFVSKDLVRISSKSSPSDSDWTSPGIVIFITSLVPVFYLSDDIAAQNQVSSFRLDLPFTKDLNRVHARSLRDQWKRVIIYDVKSPFPSMSIRQVIIRKSESELTPIEVSIDDIQVRIEALKEELSNENLRETNNLMRLIQGTVLPQVNSGVGEIARVFFCSDDLSLISVHIHKLKEILLEFLLVSKKLLVKSRIVLFPDKSWEDSISVSSIALKRDGRASGALPGEQSNLIWQMEMERGFDNLVDIIRPLIMDIPGVDQLKKTN